MWIERYADEYPIFYLLPTSKLYFSMPAYLTVMNVKNPAAKGKWKWGYYLLF
jgi:hypothetical protein